MYIKLKSLRLECGDCPVIYEGKTDDGNHLELYLRHGHMSIELNGFPLVCTDVSHGVGSLDDFKTIAEIQGYCIDDTEAMYGSYYNDLEEMIKDSICNKSWKNS